MSEKWAFLLIFDGVWIAICGFIGFISLWTATSEIIPQIALKLSGLLFFGSATFCAVVFTLIGLKELEKIKGEKAR
jgi:hypothetical protein